MTDPELIVDAVKADNVLIGQIDGRIYPLVLPPTVKDQVSGNVLSPILPAVTYGLVSQPVEFTQDSAQYRWPRWRLRIYSLEYIDLVPIAVALASIFGDQSRTPFERSWIEYPASAAEGHEADTHRYWRALDVVAHAVAGSLSQ